MKVMQRLAPHVVLLAVAVLLAAILGPQQARTQFSAQSAWGGTSGGSANAQTISIPNLASLSDLIGVTVTYIPGFTNTGPLTLNVSSLGAQIVGRGTPSGGVVLGGGETVAGVAVSAIYGGTGFVLVNSANPALPGEIMDYGGTSCPTGWAIANGQSLNATTFSVLSGILGTTWGTSGGNVVLPDLQNRATYGRNTGTGARITSAGGTFDGTVVGNVGGVQSQFFVQSQLPNVTIAIGGTASVSGTATVSGALTGVNTVTIPPSGGANFSVLCNTGGANCPNSPYAPSISSSGTSAGTGSITGATADINGAVTQTRTVTLSPAAIVSKCIRT